MSQIYQSFDSKSQYRLLRVQSFQKKIYLTKSNIQQMIENRLNKNNKNNGQNSKSIFLIKWDTNKQKISKYINKQPTPSTLPVIKNTRKINQCFNYSCNNQKNNTKEEINSSKLTKNFSESQKIMKSRFQFDNNPLFEISKKKQIKQKIDPNTMLQVNKQKYNLKMNISRNPGKNAIKYQKNNQKYQQFINKNKCVQNIYSTVPDEQFCPWRIEEDEQDYEIMKKWKKIQSSIQMKIST